MHLTQRLHLKPQCGSAGCPAICLWKKALPMKMNLGFTVACKADQLIRISLKISKKTKAFSPQPSSCRSPSQLTIWRRGLRWGSISYTAIDQEVCLGTCKLWTFGWWRETGMLTDAGCVWPLNTFILSNMLCKGSICYRSPCKDKLEINI